MCARIHSNSKFSGKKTWLLVSISTTKVMKAVQFQSNVPLGWCNVIPQQHDDLQATDTDTTSTY
jgi:hypothetical protein